MATPSPDSSPSARDLEPRGFLRAQAPDPRVTFPVDPGLRLSPHGDPLADGLPTPIGDGLWVNRAGEIVLVSTPGGGFFYDRWRRGHETRLFPLRVDPYLRAASLELQERASQEDFEREIARQDVRNDELERYLAGRAPTFQFCEIPVVPNPKFEWFDVDPDILEASQSLRDSGTLAKQAVELEAKLHELDPRTFGPGAVVGVDGLVWGPGRKRRRWPFRLFDRMRRGS